MFSQPAGNPFGEIAVLATTAHFAAYSEFLMRRYLSIARAMID